MLAGFQRAGIVAVLLNRFRNSLRPRVTHGRSTRRRSAGGGLTVLLALLAAGAGAVDVEELALTDQFGAAGGLATEQAGLQVAIVVSAKRLRRLKPWEQAIREIDTEVPLVRVADVPRTAPTELDSVAEKLRKRLPEDVNVLIDLSGIWASAYELDVNVPNVLIFNGQGELLSRHSGMYKKSYFEALQADLQPPP